MAQQDSVGSPDQAPGTGSSALPGVSKGKPYLTVITIFHDRTHYLPEAVRSVLSQAEDDLVEVLVVGPSRPESIADLIDAGSVRFVPCSEPSLGAKVARGIEAAGGDFVAFLEDDYTFAESKVATLLRQFSTNPHLAYFQNGFDLIDSRGGAYGGRYVRRPAMRRWAQHGRIRVRGRATGRELRVLAWVPAGHSLSSMAVRRRLVADRVALIREVGYAIDLSIFAIALVTADTELVLDPISLTHLRVHDTLSNPQKVETLTVLTQLAWDGRHALLQFVNSAGPRDLTRAWEGLTAASDFIHYLKTGVTSRRTFAAALLTSLAHWDSFGVQSRWPFVALGLVSTVSPRLGRATYVALRNASAAVEAPLPPSV